MDEKKQLKSSSYLSSYTCFSTFTYEKLLNLTVSWDNDISLSGEQNKDDLIKLSFSNETILHIVLIYITILNNKGYNHVGSSFLVYKETYKKLFWGQNAFYYNQIIIMVSWGQNNFEWFF